MAMITETQSGVGFSDSFLSNLMMAFKAVAGTLRFHRTLRILGKLDDIALRDIGLTRSDLIDLQMASTAEAINALTRMRLYR